MNRYYWEPGNCSRYDLVYGTVEGSSEGSRHLLLWLRKGGSGGTAIMFDGYLHHTYMEEKMGVNAADAAALLLFLEQAGHAVGLPTEVDTLGWQGVRTLTRGDANACPS